MALRTMASKLATTIPFEKNIWKAFGRLLKRLLPLRPTPAAIDTAAIKKQESLVNKAKSPLSRDKGDLFAPKI